MIIHPLAWLPTRLFLSVCRIFVLRLMQTRVSVDVSCTTNGQVFLWRFGWSHVIGQFDANPQLTAGVQVLTDRISIECYLCDKCGCQGAPSSVRIKRHVLCLHFCFCFGSRCRQNPVQCWRRSFGSLVALRGNPPLRLSSIIVSASRMDLNCV